MKDKPLSRNSGHLSAMKRKPGLFLLWKWKCSRSVVSSSLQHLGLPVAHQAPLSMEFSGQEYWSGLPIPSPGDLLNPGTELGSPMLHANSLPFKTPETLATLGDVKKLEMVLSQSSFLRCLFSAAIVLSLPLCLLLKIQLISFSVWSPSPLSFLQNLNSTHSRSLSTEGLVQQSTM